MATATSGGSLVAARAKPRPLFVWPTESTRALSLPARSIRLTSSNSAASNASPEITPGPPRGNESRADRRLCFSRPATRPSAFRHGVRNAVEARRHAVTRRTAFEARSAIGRAMKRVSRASLPSMRLPTSSETKPNRLTVGRTRWRGGGSLWTLGRGIARAQLARTSSRSSDQPKFLFVGATIM